jgi:hypothetical protein
VEDEVREASPFLCPRIQRGLCWWMRWEVMTGIIFNDVRYNTFGKLGSTSGKAELLCGNPWQMILSVGLEGEFLLVLGC